jgi:hypothetical protein
VNEFFVCYTPQHTTHRALVSPLGCTALSALMQNRRAQHAVEPGTKSAAILNSLSDCLSHSTTTTIAILIVPTPRAHRSVAELVELPVLGSDRLLEETKKRSRNVLAPRSLHLCGPSSNRLVLPWPIITVHAGLRHFQSAMHDADC